MKKGLPKPWKLLKICATRVILMWLIAFPLTTHANSQLLDRKVTFAVKEASLETALRELQTASGVKIFFSVEHIKRSSQKTITLSAKDESLRKVLKQLLDPHNIRYRVDEKNVAIIILKTESAQGMEVHPDSVAPPGRSVAGNSGMVTVTGKVLDAATQLGMPGVNVFVKGTVNGTMSDENGKYSIMAEDSDALVFSFIGYTSVETQVNGRTVIDVMLQEDVKNLGEIVINAGYWQVKDKERTGNISRIEAEDIQKQPVSNPLAALQGRVAGLEITQGSGVPGGNFRVRIRGTNSIANGNDPLYIINGVQYTSDVLTFNETSAGILGNSLNPLGGTSPLNSINPSDIESIEVLKDADATAVYGSRGANGVILITTKKGTVGKTKVDVNFYAGAGNATRTMDLLSTKQYIGMRNEAFDNDNVTPTVANARDLLVWDTTRHTNWQKELMGGTANITDAQISISGGEKNTQFSIGTGYHKETTVFPGENSDQRFSAQSNITNTGFDDKLKTTLSVNYAMNNTDLLSQDLTAKALFLPPNAPALYKDDGELNWEGWDPSGSYENPLAYLNRRYEAKTNTLIASLETGYLILKNLEIKSRFGYTHTAMNAVNLIPVSSVAPSVAPTSLNTTNFSESSFQNWMIEPQANWKPKVGKGQFDVLVGTQFLNQVTEGLTQSASGFSSEALMKNIAAAPNKTFGVNHYTQYRYQAIFGRINYNYDGKYIVNLTGRRDGSSRFGPGNQFANFGALGAAWIFSNENFIKNGASFLSFGKLRASYGITGNDQLTDYQYLDAYTSSGPYQGVIGLTPVRVANPDFAWETNKKLETAIELGFLDGRIATAVSVYHNRSSNQLVGYPLPPTTGFTSVQANFPATVQNNGIEVELNTINITHNEFIWTTSFNLSVPRNKLVEFPGLENSAYADQYKVGEPLNIRKLYNYLGVDPTTGLYEFEDVNEDGGLDAADRQTIEFIGPQYFGGFLNSFSYKGFQLELLFQFAKQTGLNYIFTTGTPGYMYNQPMYVNDRWRTEGDSKDIQRYGQSFDTAEVYGNFQASDRAVSDASFVRLKNISISYLFPDAWVQKIKLSNARIFLQGQNLLTMSNYKGLDPETQGNSLPPVRMITAGVSLTL